MQETWVQFLGWEDPLEEGMANYPSILAWRIPMDKGAWWAVVHGVAKSWTQQNWLSTAHQAMEIKAKINKQGYITLKRFTQQRKLSTKHKIYLQTIYLITWRRAWQPTPLFLPGESPWTKEPDGLQSAGSQRLGHDWATKPTISHKELLSKTYK